MASFVGTWLTRRHNVSDYSNPEKIEITVKADDEPNALDGRFSMPGFDAQIFGSVTNESIWIATVDEFADPIRRGEVVFVLSQDGNTIHGAWTSPQHNGWTQPWYGTRVTT